MNLKDVMPDKDCHRIVSVLMDINFYPNSALFKIKGPVDENTRSTMQGIAICKDTKSEDTYACFIPILNEYNKEETKQFIESELSMIHHNRKLKGSKLNLVKFYHEYIHSISNSTEGIQKCDDSVKKLSVSDCLTKLLTNSNNKEKIDHRAWNNWYCCLVRSNMIGSELYFTRSSIIFVVFYMQIAQQQDFKDLNIPEHVVQAICIPAFVEQLAFYILHHKNPKYLRRAKCAFNKMTDETKKNLKEFIKKCDARIRKVFFEKQTYLSTPNAK